MVLVTKPHVLTLFLFKEQLAVQMADAIYALTNYSDNDAMKTTTKSPFYPNNDRL